MAWNVGTKAGTKIDNSPLGEDYSDSLEQDRQNQNVGIDARLGSLPVSPELGQMLSRGMPQGVPGWADKYRRQLEDESAPSWGDAGGLHSALTAQYAGDPTRGAMADYRYGLAARLAQSGRAPSYAELAHAGVGASRAGAQAEGRRSEGLLDALSKYGTQSGRIGAANADWTIQRGLLGRQMANLGMQDKREAYNRYLDEARNSLFKGQVDMRRNLADQKARNEAYREFAGGAASTGGALLSQWPGGSPESHDTGSAIGAGDEYGGADYSEGSDYLDWLGM